jgi:hypothetical protein
MSKITLSMPLNVVDDKVNEPSKVVSMLTSVKDSALEALKAARPYGSGLLSSLKSLSFGIGAAVATAKALGNLGKLAFYDTTRVAANTLYYQDEKAAEAAKKEGTESLAVCSKELEVACHKTKAMLSNAYDATLSTIEGLKHTKDSLYYAGDATAKGIQLGLEAGAIVYQGAKDAYNMLPAYRTSIAQLNAPAEIEMTTLSSDLGNFLNASAAAAA